MADAARLQNEIVNSGLVLDPERTHHEFVSGLHGRKLDFGAIKRGSPLYELWTETAADFIREEFPRLPEIIMGVAKGTNLAAWDTADHFGEDVRGMVSRRDMADRKKPYLSHRAVRTIQAVKPELVVVLEDVGTTGFNSVQVAQGCLEAGARDAEVVVTWKRRQKLERLEAAGIPYRSIIDDEIPTYTADECREEGLCAAGWKLIPYGQEKQG